MLDDLPWLYDRKASTRESSRSVPSTNYYDFSPYCQRPWQRTPKSPALRSALDSAPSRRTFQPFSRVPRVRSHGETCQALRAGSVEMRATSPIPNASSSTNPDELRRPRYRRNIRPRCRPSVSWFDISMNNTSDRPPRNTVAEAPFLPNHQPGSPPTFTTEIAVPQAQDSTRVGRCDLYVPFAGIGRLPLKTRDAAALVLPYREPEAGGSHWPDRIGGDG
ncbi:MAG: hypothetical protein ACI81L_002367 [Verrucomicrobiales bacterium]|jgi:hypothetical protein